MHGWLSLLIEMISFVHFFQVVLTLVVSLGIALPASPTRASSNIIVNTNTDDTTTNGQSVEFIDRHFFIDFL